MEDVKHPWEAIVLGLSLPVLIWRWSPGDPQSPELAYANPAGADTFRLPPDHAVNRRFDDVMPDSSIVRRVEDLRQAIVDTLRSGETRHLRGVSIHFPNTTLDCLHFQFVPLPTSEVAMVGESPYKGYLDNFSDVFGVLSPAGDMLYVTPSAATNFGFSTEHMSEAINGLTIDDPGMSALIDAWYYVMSNEDATRKIEYRRQSRDGAWHDMELIARHYTDDPRIGGVLFNSRDISQRKADERKILALNEELEAFTYTVSHDLRLPLRLVAEILSRTLADEASTLSEQARRDLNRADALTGDMTTLIRDLLAFSRTGNAALERTVVDLSALAREVCEELVFSGVVTRDVFAIQDGLRAVADPPLLRQVLANIMGNAVKFSQHVDRPRIELTGTSGATVTHFQVRDNGVGFEPEQASKLFTVFRRLHQDPAIPGTGVGLAIVKRVVERHGGEVWAEGSPGAGAAIHVVLPVGNPWNREE
ncbi:MAG: PAS domain S-box protein [Candidatus Hydrogenedentes bacterium]|nr:PAS domain S-box protein [Candidatus Hydrogenedentota bacterium]